MKSSTIGIILVSCFTIYADACNKTIMVTETEMNLTTPGFPIPNKYDNCWWILESNSPDELIGIHVVFHVQWSQLCNFGHLVLYDGKNASAPVLGTMCGTGKGGWFVSSGHALSINFRSDKSTFGDASSFRVVRIDKDESCGGELTASTNRQHLELPKHFEYLPWNFTCTWTITADKDNNIIDVTTYPSYDGRLFGHCQSGYVEFYNGHTTSASELISEVCPSKAGPCVVSSQDRMKIVFKAGALTDSGFGLTYRSVPVTRCNRTVIATPYKSAIMSPGFPNAYYNDLNCIIQIETTMPYIRLEVMSVDIEGSFPGCDSDSLTIYKDRFLTDTKQTLCGKPSPRVIYSTGDTMAIQFRTDSHTVKQGFRLKVTSVLHDSNTMEIHAVPHVAHCGNTSLIASSEPQYLTSPDYPRDYHNNVQCTWNISAASSGMIIRLVFENLDIEASSFSSDACDNDYLKAYNEYISAHSVFMTVCGDSLTMGQSLGSHVYLVFRTDGSTTGRGFKLKYFQTNERYHCSRNVNVHTGVQWIKSPNYPWEYPSNQDCRWTLQGPINTNLNLTAVTFIVEESTDCSYDYVIIYDGLESIPPNTARLCGSDLYNYVSSGNSLTIIFHSDNSGSTVGFKYRVEAGHFSSYSSKINDLQATDHQRAVTSPNYPFEYPPMAQMLWRIDSKDKNNPVTVTFKATSKQHSPPCYSNYVEVFNGFSDSASSLGRFCADTSSKISSGRYMFLKFISGSSFGPGFKLTYSTVYDVSNDDSSSSNVGAILGGIFGGIGSVLIIGKIILSCISSKRKQAHSARTVEQTNIHTISSREEPASSTPAPSIAVPSAPPPSYTAPTSSSSVPTAPPPSRIAPPPSRIAPPPSNIAPPPSNIAPPPSYTVATAEDINPPPYSEVALHYKRTS